MAQSIKQRCEGAARNLRVLFDRLAREMPCELHEKYRCEVHMHDSSAESVTMMQFCVPCRCSEVNKVIDSYIVKPGPNPRGSIIESCGSITQFLQKQPAPSGAPLAQHPWAISILEGIQREKETLANVPQPGSGAPPSRFTNRPGVNPRVRSPVGMSLREDGVGAANSPQLQHSGLLAPSSCCPPPTNYTYSYSRDPAHLAVHATVGELNRMAESMTVLVDGLRMLAACLVSGALRLLVCGVVGMVVWHCVLKDGGGLKTAIVRGLVQGEGMGGVNGSGYGVARDTGGVLEGYGVSTTTHGLQGGLEVVMKALGEWVWGSVLVVGLIMYVVTGILEGRGERDACLSGSGTGDDPVVMG